MPSQALEGEHFPLITHMNFYPLLPLWCILVAFLLTVSASIYSYRCRNPAVEPWQHTLLIVLRMISVALVTLMLLCPGRLIEERNLEKSHIVFLLDRSASMATRDLPSGQSRLEKATAYLLENRFNRLADYPIDYYTFDSQAQRHSGTTALAALKPGGGTDFKQAVACVDKDIGLNRTAALVFLTDGIDHSGFRGSELAVPVISVQTGTDLAKVKDVGIEPFKCPAKLSENEELHLEIPLLMQGYATEQRIPFRVLVDGLPIYASTPVLNGGRMHFETVKTAFSQTGIHLIRIECDVLPDEVSDLNNRREFAVEVVAAKEEVAAYFPILNNSFRPLLREFTKDEENVFTAAYRVSAGTYRVMGRKMNRLFQSGLPENADALKSVTCLILGSHNGELLTPAEALALEQYVDKGGSLICLAGSDSFGKLPPGSPLLRLLPVVNLEDSFLSGTFRLEPDPAANDAFAGQVRSIIADNPASADFTLKSINQVKAVKATAKVELWAEGEMRHPLLVWHTYGRGKVVALLSNTFHLWGVPDKRDDNFGRFWRQLISFSKSVDDDADLLKVTLPKTELAADERVSLTVLARHPDGDKQTLTVKADVFPIDRDTPVFSRTLDRQTESFMAELPGLKPGRYVLRVSSHDDKTLLRSRYKLLLVGDVLSESTHIRSDRTTFLNYSSARHIFGPDDASALEDSLADAVRKNIVLREEFLIFENPALFLILLTLLIAEWFLRRRFNLF